MKRKSVFRALVMVLALLIFTFALTACGGRKGPTEDDVKKVLKEAGYIEDSNDKDDDDDKKKDKDDDEDDEDDEEADKKDDKKSDKPTYSVSIDKTKLNDDKTKATVTATLTVTKGGLKAVTEFKIKFKYKESSKKWKADADDVEQKEDTKYTLTGGPTEDEVADLLKESSLYGDTESFYSSDFDSVKEKGEGKVEELEYKGTYEAVYNGSWKTSTVTVDLTLKYDEYWGWYIENYEIGDVESEVSEEYAFNLSEDDVIDYLVNNNSYLYTKFLGDYSADDTIVFSDVTIGDVEVTGTSLYDIPVEFKATINSALEIDYTAEMDCDYDEDKGWYISYLSNMTETGNNASYTGTWSGTIDDIGTTATVEITDELNDNGYPICNVTVVCSSDESWSWEVGTYKWTAYLYEYEVSSSTTSMYVSYDKMVSCPEGGDTDYMSFSGNIEAGKWVIDYYDHFLTKAE